MSISRIAQLAAAGNAGAAGAVADPNFADTTLLLQGDTSNEAMLYNAFGDASSNAHDITAVGGVYGTPFSPYNNSWSVDFDGSGDYLTVADNSVSDLGTGDFTIEFWMNTSTTPSGYTVLVGNIQATNGTWRLSNSLNGSDTLYWTHYSGGYNDINTSTSVNDGQWHHIACVRSGTTLKIYIDGVEEGSGNVSTDLTSGVDVNIAYETVTPSIYTGYLSNVRIVKGTAVYTANFTPSTTPLTDISGTSLLTCNANRFIDTSSNAHAITVNGDPEIKGFSPFTDTDTVTGSGYFDGSGDYLSVADDTGFDTDTSFTVDTWVYMKSSANQTFFGRGGGVGSWSTSNGHQFLLFIESGTLYWMWNNSGSPAFISTTAPALNTWHHFAIGHDGTTTRFWLNGTSLGSSTSGYTLPTTRNIVRIGTSPNSTTANPDGYISNLRFVRGTDVYGVGNTSITPPTSPLTAVSGTSLLTLQNRGANRNIGFIDSSHPTRVITRNGNVTQGSFSPFSQDEGKWGVYFDDNISYLRTPTTSDFNLSTNDFCYEGWIWAENPGALNYSRFFGLGPYYQNVNSFGVNIADNAYSDYITAYWSDGTLGRKLISSTTLPANQWNHLAVVRNGSNFGLFLNGTRIATYTSSNAIGSGNNYAFVGDTDPVSGNEGYIGYFSNVRLINGSSVYDPTQATIAVPSSPLTDIANTKLLVGQSNRLVDNSSVSNSLTLASTPKVTPFSPFAPSTAYDPATKGGSGYFDGTGDYLSVPQNSWTYGSSDFTIDGWIYPTSTGTGNQIIGSHESGTTTNLLVYLNGSSQLTVGWNQSQNFSGSSTVPENGWTHFAVVRDGGTLRTYQNGVQVGTDSIGVAISSDPYATTLGADQNGDESLYFGYMSDIRVIVGTCLYPSGTTFSIPTAPVTAISGTSLLCNFTNAGIYDGTGRNVLETVGDAQVDTAVKKYGTGSMQFDGVGDYLDLPSSTEFGFGSGDFTIEMWAYLNTVSGTQNILDFRSGGTTQVAVTLYMNGASPRLYVNGADRITGGNLSTGQFYHIALTRSGTDTKLFVDGTQSGSTYTDSNAYLTPRPLRIGTTNDGTPQFPLNGYIDDLRITKGVARYTANFTPPAAKLPNL